MKICWMRPVACGQGVEMVGGSHQARQILGGALDNNRDPQDFADSRRFATKFFVISVIIGPDS